MQVTWLCKLPSCSLLGCERRKHPQWRTAGEHCCWDPLRFFWRQRFGGFPAPATARCSGFQLLTRSDSGINTDSTSLPSLFSLPLACTFCGCLPVLLSSVMSLANTRMEDIVNSAGRRTLAADHCRLSLPLVAAACRCSIAI